MKTTNNTTAAQSTITTKEIESMETAAGQAGDWLTGLLCGIALGRDMGAYELDEDDRALVASTTAEQARARLAAAFVQLSTTHTTIRVQFTAERLGDLSYLPAGCSAWFTDAEGKESPKGKFANVHVPNGMVDAVEDLLEADANVEAYR